MNLESTAATKLVGGASLDAAEFANIVRFESHLLTD